MDNIPIRLRYFMRPCGHSCELLGENRIQMVYITWVFAVYINLLNILSPTTNTTR